ncbi:MAG: glycosyl hydrolase [Tangfeifania sp.]
MKKIIFLFSLISLFSCSQKNSPEIPEDGRFTKFDQLKTAFENPPPEYRTAPFWVWNNDVSKEDIDRSLESFKEQGIGGVFLHPRYGLITEYLSDEWWELVDYSLQKAEELDMKLWIYDENSFPSGFAGGHVAAQMPEANSEGVALQPHFMEVLDIPENLERVKHVFKKEGDSWIEISAENEIGNEGEYCVLDLNDYERSKWFGGYSYVDLLKPGVTEKFIEITMPGYEKTLGEEFGKRVPGVFTDEPNINTRRAGPIRYTPDLYEQFEKDWGYRLEPHLMSLIKETGDWKNVRHNYQSTLLQLFIDRWSKPWYEYTEANNLSWTGHYWEHGWPNPKHGGDNMAMYAWHQVPGIDMLFNSEEARPDQFGNIRNVKELSSVVNQFQRHRALSETYGAAGWELTFEDMKRLGDWEFVLGVNLMNQHLSYMSLAGDRKHDFPQSFGPHAPYWGVYKYQADYFARLSTALSSGIQDNDILVIEPTTTAWMYFNPTQSDNRKINHVKNEFENFLEQLEKYQVEYDLGSENIIKDHGRVEEQQFIVNKADYDLVILPPGLENLDSKTYELIQRFIEKGGEIWQVDSHPEFLNGEPKDFSALQQSENWKIFEKVNADVISQLAENESIHFLNADSAGGNIFHQRRILSDGQLLFFTNFNKYETGLIEVEMEGRSVLEMHPENGKTEPYVFERNNGDVSFSVHLPPSGSSLLFVSGKRVKSKKDKIPVYEYIPAAKESKITRVNPNILTLDYVELTLDEFEKEPMYFYTAANEIWKAHGFPDNPWVSSSQFKTELIDMEPFPEETGFTVHYPFYVDDDFQSEKVQLVVERPWLYTVKINDRVISPIEGETWLDFDFHVFNVGDFLKSGRNVVELTASPFSIYAELEPVYLLGDFAVMPDKKGWLLENEIPLDFGSWKKQGLPFYGQVVAYSRNIPVKVENEYIVKLNSWEGTVAEVLVNGEHKGIIQAPPYELKVILPYGKNEVTVKVAGSLKNTFGPHHNVSTQGIVTPWSFKFAPEVQPFGREYDLINYGLMQDFEIHKLR